MVVFVWDMLVALIISCWPLGNAHGFLGFQDGHEDLELDDRGDEADDARVHDFRVLQFPY